MKVLVLAGGYDQIALIKELKKYGNEVILADYFENPPAKDMADQHFQISTLDEDAVYNLAVSESVELITTACTDQALLTVACVSERLGLPCYISSQTAMNVTNKAFMKKIFEQNNIRTAPSIVLDDRFHWKEQLNNRLKFPLVVKPCDCNSSKGVVKVSTKDELNTAVNGAFDLSRSGKVIVESYIDGREVSIDVWVDDEQAKVLSVSETEKIPNDDESFTICKSIYPVVDIDKYYGKIKDTANSIAKAFNLKNCPILIQALLCENNIFVIEFSARMGGGTKYELIQYMSGIDIMNVYVQRILGNEHQILNPVPSKKCIELDYIYAEDGTVCELINFEKLKDDGIIDDFFQYKSIGSNISQRKTSSDRVAGILITDDTKAGLCEKRKFAREKLDILDNGKSIICSRWI